MIGRIKFGRDIKFSNDSIRPPTFVHRICFAGAKYNKYIFRLQIDGHYSRCELRKIDSNLHFHLSWFHSVNMRHSSRADLGYRRINVLCMYMQKLFTKWIINLYIDDLNWSAPKAHNNAEQSSVTPLAKGNAMPVNKTFNQAAGLSSWITNIILKFSIDVSTIAVDFIIASVANWWSAEMLSSHFTASKWCSAFRHWLQLIVAPFATENIRKINSVSFAVIRKQPFANINNELMNSVSNIFKRMLPYQRCHLFTLNSRKTESHASANHFFWKCRTLGYARWSIIGEWKIVWNRKYYWTTGKKTNLTSDIATRMNPPSVRHPVAYLL